MPVPKWIDAWRKRTTGRPKDVTREDLVAFIVAGVEAITGKPPVKVPSKGYGVPLLNMWARLGFQPLGLPVPVAQLDEHPPPKRAIAGSNPAGNTTLGDISEHDTPHISPRTALGDVRLLADACRRCPAKPFREDLRGVRADGTQWKDAPLSWIPQAVCRLDPPKTGGGQGATVEQRLELARKWRADGFPTVPDDQPLEAGLVLRNQGRQQHLSLSERFAAQRKHDG